MEDCPTIRSEDLSKRAEAFAADLAAQLTDFNERNPDPEMSTEERLELENQLDRIPRLTPEQMKPLFEEVFCRYMSSHYGIVPMAKHEAAAAPALEKIQSIGSGAKRFEGS